MARLGDFEVHPFADKFPLVDGEDFELLVNDIKENGLHEAITVTHDKQTLIDGRNRLRACLRLGLSPKLHVLGHHYTEEQILNLIVSENVHRRHLTAGQRALLALEYEKAFAVEAKKRSSQAPGEPRGEKQGSHRADRPTETDQAEAARAREQAAKKTGASGRSVQRAKRLAQLAPDLAQKVLNGEISLDHAEGLLRTRIAEQNKKHKDNEADQQRARAEEELKNKQEAARKATEEEKRARRESEQKIRDQREKLEDWSKRIDGQAEALQISVFRKGLHEGLMLDERKQYAQVLRNARTKISSMINTLEKVADEHIED